MNSDKKDIVTGMVMQTMDYSKFRILEGNRPVLESRKQRIRKSINDNGVRFSPIVVNEKYEIIDGQGRFEVFKEKGLPIDYIIHNGMTLQDCVVLNSTTTAWTLQDYVESYIAQGNLNYLALKNLSQNHKQIPLGALMFSISGNAFSGNTTSIKNGDVMIDEKVYIKADAMLTYAEKFLERFESGNKALFLQAVMFCWGVEGVDTDKLFTKWDKFAGTKAVSIPVVKIYDAIEMLERAYNYKSPTGSLMYFRAAYDRWCREKNAAYSARWGLERKEKKGKAV